jgi:hypothetical protein
MSDRPLKLRPMNTPRTDERQLASDLRIALTRQAAAIEPLARDRDDEDVTSIQRYLDRLRRCIEALGGLERIPHGSW